MAVEILITTGWVHVAGEITTPGYADQAIGVGDVAELLDVHVHPVSGV